MATKPTPSGREIVRAYEQARAREARAGRDLTPKAFLDIVSPSKHGRSEASSRRYLAKLRTGERSGTALKRRAESDSGKRVNVSFVNRETGEIVSANVVIPYGRSRLDLFKPSRKRRTETALRQAAARFIDVSYAGRKGKSITKMDILGVRSVQHTKRAEAVA